MRKEVFKRRQTFGSCYKALLKHTTWGFPQDKTTLGDPFRSTENAPLLLREGQTEGPSLSLVELCLFHDLFAVRDPVISSVPEEQLHHWRLFLAFSITSLKQGTSLSSETFWPVSKTFEPGYLSTFLTNFVGFGFWLTGEQLALRTNTQEGTMFTEIFWASSTCT